MGGKSLSGAGAAIAGRGMSFDPGSEGSHEIWFSPFTNQNLAVREEHGKMAKPSKKSRRNKASPPAVELAPRRASAERRLQILERLTCGLTVAHIARLENLTVHRVRQIIAGMLEKRELDPPDWIRATADRPAQRGDDRGAHHDDGGRSSGDGPNDQADARARPLSRLRAVAAPRPGGGGVAPPRNVADARNAVGARRRAREIFLLARP